jgi:hypothetical protein
MTFVLFITYILYKVYRSWTIGRDIFFSAEDYTNMSYYNCCGIRPKHSNISKSVGEVVITICVVLDQNTVIFKKGGGITICVVLDQNHGNVMFFQLVSNLQSMFPS